MKAVTGLLTVGLMGLTGMLTGCGGGGAGSSQSYSISVRADASSLPVNIASVGPSIGGSYTTTLYVDVKDADGKPIPAGEDNVGCSFASGLDSGALFYLDGDPEHEKTETVDGDEITTQNAYRAVTLSTNAGLATFHYHASSIVGPATIRCTVTDPGGVVRAATTTIQVGSNTASGQVSQVVFDTSSPNYLFVQGFNGPTQIQMQANLVDEAGVPITNIPAGANNLQVRIVPDPSSLADNDATLRGVNASGQAVSGGSIFVRSINGQAQFTVVSGSTEGTIWIEALSDRGDNNVENVLLEPIYNNVVLSAVTVAPTVDPNPTPLDISTISLPEASGNIPYGVLLQATGGSAPYTWSLVTLGGLPSGLILNKSGVISGTPGGSPAGIFNFVVQVSDGRGTTRQKALAILYTPPAAIDTAPSVNTSAMTVGTVGQLYNMLVSASGGNQPYSWSAVAGTLPTGLSLSPTGVVSGIPTAAGSYTFVLTVSDGSKSSSRSVTMTVNPAPTAAPVIQTVSLPNATSGAVYAAQLNAVGGTLPYAWSATQLPAGLVIDSLTGVIATPAIVPPATTGTAKGTFTFTVRVTDGNLVTSSKDFTITIQ